MLAMHCPAYLDPAMHPMYLPLRLWCVGAQAAQKQESEGGRAKATDAAAGVPHTLRTKVQRTTLPQPRRTGPVPARNRATYFVCLPDLLLQLPECVLQKTAREETRFIHHPRVYGANKRLPFAHEAAGLKHNRPYLESARASFSSHALRTQKKREVCPYFQGGFDLQRYAGWQQRNNGKLCHCEWTFS